MVNSDPNIHQAQMPHDSASMRVEKLEEQPQEPLRREESRLFFWRQYKRNEKSYVHNRLNFTNLVLTLM